MDSSSIDKFEAMVLNSARRQRDEVLSAVNGKKDEAVNGRRREIKDSYEKRLVYGTEALKRKYNKELSEKQTEYKKEYLDRRASLTEAIFDGAKADILSYMQTPEYTKRFEKYITDITSGGVNFCAEINKNDSAMEKLLTSCGIPFTYSQTDIIGGVKLEGADSNVSYDLSYAAKFQEIRKAFYSGKYK